MGDDYTKLFRALPALEHHMIASSAGQVVARGKLMPRVLQEEDLNEEQKGTLTNMRAAVVEKFRALIGTPIDINAKSNSPSPNSKNRTVLYDAYVRQHYWLVVELIKLGADPAITLSDGRSVESIVSEEVKTWDDPEKGESLRELYPTTYRWFKKMDEAIKTSIQDKQRRLEEGRVYDTAAAAGGARLRIAKSRKTRVRKTKRRKTLRRK